MNLIIKLIETLYSAAYFLTDNYGISLILLSIAVNIILIPVYIPLERMKKKSEDKQKKMSDEIDEIKKYYKGQERYLYIQAIYKRYKYHPIQGVTMSLGLLIQIPFFIAAYQFLSHYTGFDQTSFLFIKDLAQPDNFSMLGSLHVNLLPILMTLINLLSSFLYTRESGKSARNQLFLIGGVFLFLLYNSPSALVLYWTMNNIFALGKLLFANRFAIVKQLKVKELISSLNNRTLNMFFGLSVLSLYFLISFVAFYNKEKVNATSILMAFFISLIFIEILGFIKFITKFKKSLLYIIILSVFILRFIMQIFTLNTMHNNIVLTDFVINNNLESILFQALIQGSILLLTLPFLLSGIKDKVKTLLSSQKNSSQKIKSIYIYSVIFILLSSFYWLPSLIYTSMPSSFSFPITVLFLYNTPYFILFAVILIGLFLIIPLKTKQYVSQFSFYIAITFFLYALIIPFDFGTLEGLKFSLLESFNRGVPTYITEFLLLAALFLIIRLFFNKYRNIVFRGIIILNIIACLQALIIIVPSFISDNNKEHTEGELPKNIDNLLGFSKTEENVVIFMSDAFRGGYVEQILKDEPELNSILEGFTWFPITLSISYYTNSTMPSLVGGLDFTPDKINKMEGDSLFYKAGLAYQNFIKTTKEENFDLTIINPILYNSFEGDYDSIDKDVHTSSLAPFGEYWESLQGGSVIDNEPQIISTILATVGLFRGAPTAIKAKIYNNGDWFTQYKSGYNHAKDSWGLIDLLPELSNSNVKGKTFKLINTKFTHRPYAMSEDGHLLRVGYPDTSSNTGLGGKNPYYSAKWTLIALGDWVEWLKEQGIYDNTKIILVSDHGNQYSLTYETAYTNRERIEELGLTLNQLNRFHPLLMVKDFNKDGEFKVDNKLMTNGDTFAIALDKNSPLYAAERETIRTYRSVTWRKSELEKISTYDIAAAYDITDNIFDLENWTKIEVED